MERMALDSDAIVAGRRRALAARSGDLAIFQVMPREMYFGISRATSIDLCVRDLVAASRFRSTTTVFAERLEDHFPGFTVEALPAARHAATFFRSGHVVRTARARRPDLIVVQQHLPSAAAIARRLPDIKVVLHAHNYQKSYGGRSNPLARLRRNGRKFRYRQLAGIVHVSRSCAEAFARDWPDIGIPAIIINNGLEMAIWHPARERRPEILYAGRCAPEKGVLELAQAAAAQLPSHPGWRARFILSNLAVHPDYVAAVREALAPLGEQAIIEEQRPFAEVKAAYEQAAIAVVPSKWDEPFGRTALEAHAGGAALISSGTGGLAEVSGKAALVVQEVTADALGTALSVLITDEGLRGRLADAGAKRVSEHFDIATQAARLDDFCEAIVRR
jgi:glycosyltransferase involved in cell wall biosynthesis